MKKILITGVSGLLGGNLAYYFRDKYHVMGVYNEHPVKIEGVKTAKVNLVDTEVFCKAVADFSPDVVIHCASFTNVDGCEINTSLAKNINIEGTKTVVESLKNLQAKLVYISTDSVYEGVIGDYKETDPVKPLNYYGQTKLEGEWVVEGHKNNLVLRTNIFGWNIQDKNSLSEWILYSLKEGKNIECFDDAMFSSLYTVDLAQIINESIQQDLRGVFNCGSCDTLSKYKFAQLIAKAFQLDKNKIAPISVDSFNFKAQRGKNLSMCMDKIQTALGRKLPSIEKSVNRFCNDYSEGFSKKIKQSNVAANLNFIRYGSQMVDEEDVKAVVEVLNSSHLTQGPAITKFEKALSKRVGAKYAITFNSGTSALHACCVAAGIQKDDEVITSPNTFVASANCIVYCGGRPVFADIDLQTYNILPAEIEKKITRNTKAIIPVHFAGQSCDMKAIQRVVTKAAKQYDQRVYIIEDASHALGSHYGKLAVGSCEFSDMVVMSFHPVKHITTGEGGVVFTNDSALYKKLLQCRSHGITNNPKDFVNKQNAFQSTKKQEANPWYYEQVSLGYNYRITDLQCALGLSQLNKLDVFIKRRREIIKKYNEAFTSLEVIQIPYEQKKDESNFHLYVLRIDFDKIGIERAVVMQELRSQGIQTQVHYIPVHLQPYYQENFGTRIGEYPNAEKYYSQCLSIPLHPVMTDEDFHHVISSVKRIIQ